MDSFWASAILLVLGAGIGFLPTYLTDRRRERSQLATRWDVSLHAQSAEFVASARKLRHLASRLTPAPQNGGLAQQVDEEHAKLRALAEQVGLLADKGLQTAVRTVVRHAYAVREVAEGRPDPRAGQYTGQPDERLKAALRDCRRATRVQLRVAHPDDLAEELD